MKGNNYPRLIAFTKREKIILQLQTILENFDPCQNRYDRFAFQKIFPGKFYPEITDEELTHITDGFKRTLRANVEILKIEQKQYPKIL